MAFCRNAELAGTAGGPLLISPLASELEPGDTFAGLQSCALPCTTRAGEHLRVIIVPITAVVLCHIPEYTSIGSIMEDSELGKVSWKLIKYMGMGSQEPPARSPVPQWSAEEAVNQLVEKDEDKQLTG